MTYRKVKKKKNRQKTDRQNNLKKVYNITQYYFCNKRRGKMR